MPILNANDVRQALPMADSIDAVQDAVAARVVLSRANELGLGQKIEW